MSFYLGGKYLKSYTNNDMEKMGAKVAFTSVGTWMHIEYLGMEQIPWTNQYIFKISIPKVGIKMFDILTGEEFTKPIPAKYEPAPFDENYGREGVTTYWDKDNNVIVSGRYKSGEKWDGTFLEHDGFITTYREGVQTHKN